MSNTQNYIRLIDSMIDGDYNKSQKIVNRIVENKIESRIAQVSKEFLAKTQGK